MERILKHWKTTVMGSVVIFVALAFLYVGKLDAVSFGAVATFGAGLLFAKDDLLKSKD